ncbi:unnamed protein product [Polarella glacialis]|uniref:Uncharacterized protein n=1 Tax=Polarella glacialis TaxID=89957 RepID=A0A813GMF7_POLGL|nr:unnamed protein product [Polarella glacialis]
MTEKERLLSQVLHTVLVATTKDARRAAVLVRGVTDGNGFAAWRRLCREYQPDSAARYTAALCDLLRPPWSPRETAAAWLPHFHQWENQVADYQITLFR